MGFIEIVLLILGIGLGEIIDLWYDSRESSRELKPRSRPLAFGNIRGVLKKYTPEAFEHYHWGILIIIASLDVHYFDSYFGFFTLGVGLSLILDENRIGLEGQPFGFGKEYFPLCTIMGIYFLFWLILKIVKIEWLGSIKSFLITIVAWISVLLLYYALKKLEKKIPESSILRMKVY